MTPSLDDSIQYLKHVGPSRADDFARLDIATVRDLIWTFPRDLADRSNMFTIANCPEDRPATILATAISVTERAIKKRGRTLSGRKPPTSITTAEFTDGSGGILEVVWFNQPWLKDKLAGKRVLLHGKARRVGPILHLDHPLHEVLPDHVEAGNWDPASSLNFGRIVPVYPCTGNLNQNVWRAAMAYALDTRLEQLEDPLREVIPPEKNFPDLQWSIRNMHFPESPAAAQRARERLVWGECFFLQLTVLAARRHALLDIPGRKFAIGPELDARIRRLFPFRLTPAQDQAVAEIVHDMKSELPMQRLLQGDVGSGKTAVAMYALLAAVANKTQACIMAPTSLLARQHHETFTRFLANSENARVSVGLLVGGMSALERSLVLERLANGTLDIVSATHSAISDSVVFRDLGLVVIDEQHKFGVRQRIDLARKGVRPDTLVMTATPIPRSLALSAYGDLDLSVIGTLPPGRKPVKTVLASKSSPGEGWKIFRRELAAGRQGFVVCPLVEESEESDLRSAEKTLREVADGVLKDYRLELLHGRMKRSEQAEIMARFRAGAVDALVSTIVIEVGVDVPNATVMLVEDAERFGMAQLHQLRGRVGRGVSQGWFVMLSDAQEGEAGLRLGALLRAADGFAIAEADLRLRGPGEFLGTRQSGGSGLKLVDLAADLDIMVDARKFAAAVLERDPELNAREHLPVRRELVRLYGKRWDRAAGS